MRWIRTGAERTWDSSGVFQSVIAPFARCQRCEAFQLNIRLRMRIGSVARLFASFVFVAIAVVLVVVTWLPARDSLQVDQARVTRITPQPNTWHEAEFTTEKGGRIVCRGRYGWPLLGPARCPIGKFQGVLGQHVTVLHDGKRPYEVIAATEKLLDYSASRKAQVIAAVLAALMLILAALVWRRP